MKNMKKSAALAGVVGVVVICACGGCSKLWGADTMNESSVTNQTTTAAMTSSQIETTISPEKAEDMAKLEALLKGIKGEVTPGTAGSSLKATKAAAALLDFCETTSLEKKEAETIAIEWLLNLTGEEKEVWKEQISSVKDICERLRTGNAADMLEAAGITDSLYPWKNLNEVVYEAIMLKLSA